MSSPVARIIAADSIIDGSGSLTNCLALEVQLKQLGVQIRQLTIDPLSTNWHSPLKEDHFRSGCAPIEALASAKTLIESGQEQAVLISGKDLLKSDYTSPQRNKLMAVYGDEYPLTTAYNELALAFSNLHQISEQEFRLLAHALFDNYLQTRKQILQTSGQTFKAPDYKWYKPLTSLFRGVDCANPVVDFEGRILVCAPSLLNKKAVNSDVNIAVLGVGVHKLDEDGRAAIAQIASYKHLKQAYIDASFQANVKFETALTNKQALLEVYTCYPVVPLGFLMASGLIKNISEAKDFIRHHPLTITGGMNLARAPWNNPALNGLITMTKTLQSAKQTLGLVHGNGGLGYRQGVAILSR